MGAHSRRVPKKEATTARIPALTFWALLSQDTLGTTLKIPKSESPIPKTWTTGPVHSRGTVQPGHHHPPLPGAPSTWPGLSGPNSQQGGCSGPEAEILRRAGPRLAHRPLDKALGAPSMVQGELP